MVEYISKDKFIHFLFKEIAYFEETQTDIEIPISATLQSVVNEVKKFQSEDVQPVKWIPFSVRDLDEEEKAEHPEWDWILEGELPEDGQRILVNVKYRGHEAVQMDEYYNDDGCYLDSGYEIGTEVTHWMPLPEPPKDGET